MANVQNDNSVGFDGEQDAISAIQFLADFEVNMLVFKSVAATIGKSTQCVGDVVEPLSPTFGVLWRIFADIVVRLVDIAFGRRSDVNVVVHVDDQDR